MMEEREESKMDNSLSDLKDDGSSADEKISYWFFFSDPLLARYYCSFKITSTPYTYTLWMMIGFICYFLIYWTLVILANPDPFAYGLISLTVVIAIFPITLVCLLRKKSHRHAAERSPKEPVQRRIAWLESCTVLGFVIVFSLIHIMRSYNGPCPTENYAEIWHCLPALASLSIVSETVLILLMLPLLFSIILPHVHFTIILISMFISIGVAAITSGLLQASGSATWVFFLIIFLLVIQFFYQRQHMELFLYTWRYQQSIQARERDRRMQETKLATEMRNMVASVSHDLKSPLAAFICGVEMIRDLLRIPCLVNEESSLKSNTKSNHSSAFTTSSFDDSGATMPILHSIPASNTAVITEMQRALNGIESAYYLLLMTVNRSTDFTKSIHGIPLAPQWEFVNVGDVASKSIQIISYLQQDATIQLHQDFHGGLLTDQQWLLDNLLCLISNSVKYSTHCVDIQVFILKKSHKDSYDFISLQRNYAYFVHISEEMSGEEAMEWVHIEVWDRGKGLTTQNAINIFNAPDFSSQRPVGGSGLGLYCLGKRLDMLGGCYGVSPRPDTQPGSMFWILMPINSKVADLALFRRRKVILPNIKELTSLRDEEVKSAALNDSLRFKAKPPSAIEEVQLTNTTPNSQIPVGKAINVVAKQNLTVKANEEENMPRKDNLHILLVDDSLPILKMLRMMLERSGYHVESASDGYGALQQLFGEDVNLECDPDAVPPTATIHPSDRHKFDVVLMDLQMPEMDGFQAIRCIRQRENECIRRNGEAGNGKHHQLILAMSANSDANTRQEALQVGADCFIPKPFKMDMFYDALQSCWEQYDT